MNVISRGFRNAFRNTTRSVSIIIILGLAIGLSLVMVIARQAVSNKINSVNGSIGNTVTIAPAGFSSFSSVNNSLTTTELAKVSSLDHVTGLSETLTDRLTTIGSSAPSFFGSSSSSSSANQTSLTSPVKININHAQSGNGPSLFISGGNGASLPTNFTLPISIIGTNNPNSVNSTSLILTSGQSFSGTSDSNEALISSAMASTNSLKVGSTFSAYSTTMSVAGIFNASSTDPLAGEVVVSLPTEERLSGQAGDVTSAIASVDSLTNLNTATNEIKKDLGSNANVTSSVEQAQAATAPLSNIKTITLYSLLGAVVAGIVIIFLIMIMIVRERRREIGMLKAIGASNLKVVWQFMSEAITLTLAGAIIGMAIGIAAANPITHFLVTSQSSSSTTTGAVVRGPGGGGFGGISSGNGNFSFHASNRGAFRGLRNSFGSVQAVVGWSVIGYGIGAAVVIAVIGSAASSMLIARVRPADVMRME